MRKTVQVSEDEIRQAVAHFLSRQGSLEFDRGEVWLDTKPGTGEIVANAISRDTYAQ